MAAESHFQQIFSAEGDLQHAVTSVLQQQYSYSFSGLLLLVMFFIKALIRPHKMLIDFLLGLISLC